ncbi:hypothetical protein JB92DRAFT_3099155 [Gautieria morchelliformis]|nr:hypothetical protein JB92DRAFT_3099155 [Gautieria morchelliformis]
MSFQQTGKVCIHLAAARLEQFNGSCVAWTEIESANQRWNPMRGTHWAHREVKRTSDARITKDLLYIVDQLDHHSSSAPEEDPATTPRALSPGKSGSEMQKFLSKPKARRGRLARIRPMQPWRIRAAQVRKHVPHFSRKPGRNIAKCLVPNSLFPAGLLPKGKWVTYETAGDRPRGQKKWSLADVPDDLLDAEELSINSMDLSRWASPTYELRIEEMELFVELLNNLSDQ